jgi:hypothetical protein
MKMTMPTISTMPISRTWSWILIAAAVALIVGIWLPWSGTAHAANPTYIFPDENPNYVPPTVDNDTKPSPFPGRPVHYSR